MRALSLLLIIAGFVAVIAVTVVNPGLDLRITSHFFFDSETKRFFLADHPVIVSLRNLNSAVDIIFGVVIAAAVIYAWLVPAKPPFMSRRTVIFLVVTFALSAGVVSNLIFKENWGRPRPYHVVEYDGASKFMEWWDPRGTCKRSCSFYSGEVSAAAWTIAPAVLVSGPLGAVAVAGAIAFPFAIAVVRMAQGGHFFSDAAFGALFTWLIVWVAYGWCYRRKPRKSRAVRQ